MLLGEIIGPALLLAGLALSVKPVVFHYLLRRFEERNKLAWDAGLRLGQISEFSLLIAYVATQSQIITATASLIIQAAAIITFVVSSYIVVLFCTSPISISEKLRRD